jgi:hypothetical protein
MVPSPDHPEPHSRTTRRSWIGLVPPFLATVIGFALLAIAIWGLWASADVAHLVANAAGAPEKHNLSSAAFLLVWLVFFGPFLYFGVAILWSAFSRGSHAGLAPLRLFSFIVSLRIAAEESRRLSSDKSGEKALPAPRPSEQVGLSPDSTQSVEDPGGD